MRAELIRFLVVGFTTVAIDYLCYRLLAAIGWDYSVSKAVSFVAGTVFAYFANRLWTFHDPRSRHAPGSVWRFALLYSSTLLINVAVNAALLVLLRPITHGLQAAFIVATGVSAALNFVGMKYFVFARPSRGARPS